MLQISVRVSVRYYAHFPAYLVLLIVLATVFLLQMELIAGVCCKVLTYFIKKEKERKGIVSKMGIELECSSGE